MWWHAVARLFWVAALWLESKEPNSKSHSGFYIWLSSLLQSSWMYENSKANLSSLRQCRDGLLMLQDGPVQPGAHWHSKPWLDSTQLPPFRHGSDRQALSAAESQRERCYNVVLTHNQSKTETEQHFQKECTKYTDILPQNKTHGPHICQTMTNSLSIWQHCMPLPVILWLHGLFTLTL